jgi:hypothetical protein
MQQILSKKEQRLSIVLVIGRVYDGVIWLPLPESLCKLSFLFRFVFPHENSACKMQFIRVDTLILSPFSKKTTGCPIGRLHDGMASFDYQYHYQNALIFSFVRYLVSATRSTVVVYATNVDQKVQRLALVITDYPHVYNVFILYFASV